MANIKETSNQDKSGRLKTEFEHLLPEHQSVLLQAIFEAEPHGLAVLTGPELVFQYANPAYRSLTPRPETDLIGRTYNEIWPPSEGFNHRPVIERTLQTGEPVQVEHHDRKYPDGSTRYFSFSLRRLQWSDRPAVLDILWETTELEQALHLSQQATETARRRAEELNAIFDAMADAVIVFNAENILIRANPAAIANYGFDPHDLDQRSLLGKISLRYPDGRPVDLKDLPSQRAMRGETIRGERYLIVDVEGNELTVIDSASPLYTASGSLAGAVVVWHDVSERERLLAQLDAEQARLRAILEHAPEAVVVTDAQSRIILTNPAADEIFARPVPLGEDYRNLAGLHFCYPDGTPYDSRNLPMTSSALDGESLANVQLAIEWPDGQLRDLLMSSAPILDRKGNVGGAVAVIQDITQRKRADEQMRRHAAQAEVLNNLSQAFAEVGMDYHALLETVARQLAGSIGDACLIRLISEDSMWLEQVAYYYSNPDGVMPVPDQFRISPERPGQGLSGRVFESGEPELIPFVPPRDRQSLGELDCLPANENFVVRSLLIVPMDAQSHVIGTLCMMRYQPNEPYDVDDQVFVRGLANRAALSVENARLYMAEAQRARELDALHTATTALLTTLDLENLLGHILDAALSAIPTAQSGALYLIAPDTGQLQMRAMHGYNDPRIKKFSSMGKDDFASQVVAKIIKQKKPGIFRDKPAKNQPKKSAEIRCAIASPLLLEGRSIGALYLETNRPDDFNEAELRLLQSFASTTTTAIQNARLHGEIQKQAITDALTGLYNRRGLDELGQREVDRARRYGRPLAAIMLDIDHFKRVNDMHTHAIGDQVLQALAAHLKSGLREVDILGRYGGEEFAILLPETDLFTACSIAERLRQHVASMPMPTGHGPISITISLGVSRVSVETQDLASLLSKADQALYAAKQAGRNRLEVG